MEKNRNIFPLRLTPDTTDMVKAIYTQDNCASQNEFIEKAVKFYISYLTTERETSYLNTMLYNAMKSALKESENRQASLLFKLAVEMNLMMNILAAGLNISEETLKSMRGRCIKEVKASRGRVSFEDALEYQNS